MQISRGTQAILDLEDDQPDVLFERLPGTDTLIWPLLRMPLAQTTAESELGTAAVRRRVSALQVARRILERSLPSARDSRAVPNSDYLFVAGGGTIRQTGAGRYNWLVEPFATAIGQDAAILQDQPIPRRGAQSELPTFTRTFSFDDASSRVDLATRVRPLSDPAADHARRVMAEIFRRFDYPVEPARLATIERQLVYRLGRIRHLDREFERIVNRVGPRVVFMDGASYGSRSSLIRMLRQRGVAVVEPQHGWIGPTHAAYNFGAAMATADLATTLPDALMTFGSFWSSELRFPGRTIPIGKPHLDEVVTAVQGTSPKKEMLLVSSVFDNPRLVRIGISLRRSLPEDWVLVVRPHPSERTRAEEIFRDLIEVDGVELDRSTDVYDPLGRAGAVVGYASTVLYEALAFGPPVFVIDSSLADLYADERIFRERITDDDDAVEHAVERILSGSASRSLPESDAGSIWAERPLERFQGFLDELRGDASCA